MKKLKFNKDEGTAFYKDLVATLDHYFLSHRLNKEGNHIMHFKITMYFGLVLLFYLLMLFAKSFSQDQGNSRYS